MKNSFLILCLTVILCFTGAGFGQKEAPQCRELPAREFNLNLRFEAPARIMDFSGQKIFYNVPTGKTVIAGLSMEIGERTELPINFLNEYEKGLWRIVFCADTGEVVIVYRIVEKYQGKFETKREMDARLAQKRQKTAKQ